MRRLVFVAAMVAGCTTTRELCPKDMGDPGEMCIRYEVAIPISIFRMTPEMQVYEALKEIGDSNKGKNKFENFVNIDKQQQ